MAMCIQWLQPLTSVCIDIDDHNKDEPSDSDVTELDDDISYSSHNQDWLDCTEDRAAIGAVHISDQRRHFSVSIARSRIHLSGSTNYMWPGLGKLTMYMHCIILREMPI